MYDLRDAGSQCTGWACNRCSAQLDTGTPQPQDTLILTLTGNGDHGGCIRVMVGNFSVILMARLY